MSQEKCPICGIGIFSSIITNSEGYTQKKYSCGHTEHESQLVEKISLSDNINLGRMISGSLANLSGSAIIASELVKNIPEEKLESFGVGKGSLNYLEIINQNIKLLNEKITKLPNYTIIWANNVTAPIQISQKGDNIIIKTDVQDSFNKINQEIDASVNIDSSIKIKIKSEINELREEIGKEKPDKNKILKIWDEVKDLAPFLVSLSQLAPVISKILLGV